jgi:hypothetical protein
VLARRCGLEGSGGVMDAVSIIVAGTFAFALVALIVMIVWIGLRKVG